jgi:hypothetical protein
MLFEYPDCTLLVSCCNINGGLYQLQCKQNQMTVSKILNGNYRGIAKYKDKFIIVTTNTVSMLNSNFQMIKRNGSKRTFGYHGVVIDKNKAYIVESAKNAIGIYELSNLTRIGEIKMSPEDVDVNHMNDLYMNGDKIYLSMFSDKGEWRKKPMNSGAIIQYSLKDKTKKKVHSQLKQPHSITCFDKHLFYCNSAELAVKKGEDTVFESFGYLRGLAFRNNFMFIGQSESRHLETVVKNNLNVSVDCGIHVFDYVQKMSKFVSLPSKEVYDILVV